MRGETLFLRAVVCLMGMAVLALCIFGLPLFADYFHYPVLTGMYAAALPFFFALYQTLKLLSYIDKNTAFSDLSVKALKNIKYCAIAIGTLYAGLIPLLLPIAHEDDAPGIVALGLIIVFASMVIAVFSAVLQKLLKNAIDIKSENDLTV